jgi:hypothetical protein
MQRPDSPLYLEANPADVESLVMKLSAFSRQLNERERALFMQRVKRDLNNAELADAPLVADPAAFAAWINTILSDAVRWYPA